MPVILKQTIRMPSSIKLTDKALMREIGDIVIEQIRSRTRLGRDQHGQPFAPYTQAYAKEKAAEVGGSGTVNLTVSGDMMSALTIVDVEDTSVTLGWTR